MQNVILNTTTPRVIICQCKLAICCVWHGQPAQRKARQVGPGQGRARRRRAAAARRGDEARSDSRFIKKSGRKIMTPARIEPVCNGRGAHGRGAGMGSGRLPGAPAAAGRGPRRPQKKNLHQKTCKNQDAETKNSITCGNRTQNYWHEALHPNH